MTLQSGTRFGPYEILSALGAGGMGEVYKARDTRLDRTVAIKVLPEALAADPQFRERFDREARAISSLNHPHICTLYDVGHQHATAFLVMELLEGETLAQRIAKGQLPLADALRYAIEIADALATAHRAGIVHRDLKPGNVMITRAGAKLLDFGLAKAVVAPVGGAQSTLPTTPPSLTVQGTILGTFQYMAPEQLEGQEADARSDIFAFGAMVYEMLTGKPAFSGRTQASLISAILRDTPAPIATLQPVTPVLLDHVVKRCLAKDPEERWQNAADVVRELKWVTEAPSLSAPIATKAARGNTLGWVAAALAGLAVGVAATFGAVSTSGGPETASHAIRFEVPPLNDSLSLGNAGQPMVAVSPDGRHLALVALQGATALLWVRSFDAPDARPLPNTNGATFPFWSPDSRTIGFGGGGIIRTVDVGGGPVQTIGPTPVGGLRGAALSPDGRTIVFGSSVSGLFSVPAGGGQPSTLTQIDASAGETSHRFPSFLPDGEHLVYTSVPSGSVRLLSLESKESTRLLAVDSQAQYDGAGHLVFVRQGTLMAQSFDGRSSLTGEATPIAQQVLRDANGGGSAFSVSAGGVLAYRIGGDAPKAQLAWLDRLGRRVDTPGAIGQYRNPALSPDGTRAAVEMFDPSSRKQDIWIVDLTRGISSRFTFDAGNDVFPIWSPDGKWIAFASDRAGIYSVYRKPANGTGTEELVLKSTVEMLPNSWTPDGGAIVTRTVNKSGAIHVGILSLSKDPAHSVFEERQFSYSQGSVSPDGRFVAYNSQESGRFEIYVQSFPKPGGGKWQVSKEGGGHLRWRPDGKELFYYALDGRLMAVPVLSSQPFALGPPVALFGARMLSGPTPLLGYRTQFDVARDGRFLMNLPIGDEKAPPINIVLNWAAGLKK